MSEELKFPDSELLSHIERLLQDEVVDALRPLLPGYANKILKDFRYLRDSERQTVADLHKYVRTIAEKAVKLP